MADIPNQGAFIDVRQHKKEKVGSENQKNNIYIAMAWNKEVMKSKMPPKEL